MKRFIYYTKLVQYILSCNTLFKKLIVDKIIFLCAIFFQFLQKKHFSPQKTKMQLQTYNKNIV